MKRSVLSVYITVLCCLTTLGLIPALGYSTDGSTLTRTVDQHTAVIHSPITLSITFTNASPESLRGFYYVEQVPAELGITTLNVRINGQDINDYVLEAGQKGDVSPNYIPRRWILEVPPDFAPTNPVPQQSIVEIVYSISCSSPGTYTLDDFNWIGRQADADAAFGVSDPADQQAIIFIAPDTPPVLSGSYTNEGFAVGLTGISGYSYVIEASTNLFDWAPVATNFAPFEFKEAAGSHFDQRFFRAYHLSIPHLAGSMSTNGFSIGLTGTPGYRYIIEASTNFVDWSPVTTNLAPFEFKEDRESSLDHCFFRAYHLRL